MCVFHDIGLVRLVWSLLGWVKLYYICRLLPKICIYFCIKIFKNVAGFDIQIRTFSKDFLRRLSKFFPILFALKYFFLNLCLCGTQLQNLLSNTIFKSWCLLSIQLQKMFKYLCNTEIWNFRNRCIFLPMKA